MKKRFFIVAIPLISTVLYQSYTTAMHVEPILSPLTEYLYTFDPDLGGFLSDICDCSKINSCTCNSHMGAVTIRAEISLEKVTKNVTKPIHILETIIFVGNYKLYEEKANVREMKEKCLLFEDKNSYVVNKNYCVVNKIAYRKGITQVCTSLLIRERGRITLDQNFLCLLDTPTKPK
ncbi:uncharacterized protein [Halyomorpha halys]|uniref:uncharacterized protein n=1 Tax=Halyomorpha halys TaxID=286706 RepID=UPI0006D50993|nr:uncharacterized protein LOC106692978 [Halyomorpha halys]